MLLNTLLLALRSIRRNLLRSFLTILGIVIGVSAVITMVTLGNGATLAVQNQISSLGTNLLQVRPGQRMGPGGGGGSAFKEEDAAAIASQIGGIAAVAPEARTGATVVANGRNWTSSVIGSTNDWLVTGNWKVAQGREFSDDELRALIEADKPDLVVPEIEAIATPMLEVLEATGVVRVIPTARAARLTMDREGIRRLAAETLGLSLIHISEPTRPY